MGIERRVFVVGVPRSGTTLVQSLLAAHSTVTSFTESHAFSRHFRALPGPYAALTRDPRPRMQAFLAENGIEPDRAADLLEPLERAMPQTAVGRLVRTREVAQALLGVFDALARERSLTTWVEKTPAHLRFGPWLGRLAGQQRVATHCVHVIRQGLPTVASLHRASRQWERAYDLATCVARWNTDMAFSRRHLLRRLPSTNSGHTRHHGVVYEALTQRPEAVLRRLFEALGLAWEPTVLEGYGDTAERWVTASESWKQGVGEGIRPAKTTADGLTAEQQRWVASRLRSGLYDQLVARLHPEGVAS